MLDKYKPFIAAFFLLVVCSIAYSAHYYAKLYRQAAKDLKESQATVEKMQSQQKTTAELDAKYTKDLADAQNTIDQLRDDVTAGTKRLSVRAKCLPQTSATGSVGDAGAAELSSDSRQDYYRLREQLATSDKQIRYLQDYIKGVLNGEETKADSQAASSAVRR